MMPCRTTMARTLLIGITLISLACQQAAPAAPAPTTMPDVAGQSVTQQQTTTPVQAVPADSCPSTPTPSQTEGPYYKAGSPQRSSLREPGVSGTPVTITGYVFNRSCQPVANAWLDFWQADAQGSYDNSGYRLRGHVFADESGKFTIETVVPGEYPGRTPHIHVKVRAGSGPVLTTQLYLPDALGNQRDGIFDAALVMKREGSTASYNFVLG
jgi:protocatechuate 3,4-dioxygenase beta subunit